MSEKTLKCVAPGCDKALLPKEAWLPELVAMRRANGGRVQTDDFPKFVLCGRHGHLLRQEGVRVYRYLDTLERELKRGEERQAEAMTFKPFADRFVVKTDRAGKGPKAGRRGGDGRNVGGGLSRCAQKDAEKRSQAQPAEAPAPDGATKPPAS